MKTMKRQSRQSGLVNGKTLWFGICLSLGFNHQCPAAVGCDQNDSISVTASVATIAETGGQSAQFRFSRWLVGGTDQITVEISGTAANGTDYATLPTQVFFATGQSVASLTVVPISDGTAEGTEIVTVRITGTGNSCVSIGSPASATISILDGPLVSLSVTQAPLSQSVAPAESATFSVAVNGGPPPYTYEWRKTAPAPLFTNTFILNERLSFFTLTNVQNSVTGTYRIVIRNVASPSGVSPSVFTLRLSADSDGDGLSDAWEGNYPTSTEATEDTDLDGMTNWQEYMAGTDPTNAQSYLKVDRITRASSTLVEFMAVSNKTYSVQYSDALDAPSWVNLADIVARNLNHVETVTDPNGSTNRYYRLVTPKQE